MNRAPLCFVFFLLAGCAADSGSVPRNDTINGTGGSAGGTSAPDKGCGDTALLAVPDDPGARGPWTVGVRTAKIGRLTAEIVYPAEPGSEVGNTEATYDVRDWLPPTERHKVPDSASPAVKPLGGAIYRDLPIDATHGPYPVIVYVHGTASFRIASGSTLVHWASRGFVVIGADYPGLFLADQLCLATGAPPAGGTTAGCTCPTTGEKDIPADVATQLQALNNPSGDLSFLAGRVDMQRVGLSGHSQGACAVSALSTLPNVQVVMPMTGSLQVLPSPSLKSVLFIAGIDDTVIGYDSAEIGNGVCLPVAGQASAFSNKVAYETSPGAPDVKKRLVGIAGGGHLVPTDLCQTNAQGRNAVEQAQHDDVCGIDQATYIGLPAIFDCGAIPMPTGVHAVNYVSTAALEETLLCKDRTAAFANAKTAVPVLGEFLEE